MDNNMALMFYEGPGSNNLLSRVYGRDRHELRNAENDETVSELSDARGRADLTASEDGVREDDDITFLGLVREFYPDIVKIFISGQGSLKSAMEHLNYPEVFRYFTHLWSSRELNGKISKAFAPYSLSMEDCMIQRMTSEQTDELSLINANLKRMINAPSQQLQEFVRDGIIMLATFAEAREDNTGGHIFRIRELTREICEGLDLPSPEIEDISFSSMMHDVGKIHIPDVILLKNGPLDDEEKSIMRSHCETGEMMLGDKSVYRTAREIARNHHERWDGKGYPDGLKGELIPLSARITAIADAFDALTHERSYKKTWPVGMAVREMRALSGRQFDPEILEIFFRIQSGEMKTGQNAEALS